MDDICINRSIKLQNSLIIAKFEIFAKFLICKTHVEHPIEIFGEIAYFIRQVATGWGL